MTIKTLEPGPRPCCTPASLGDVGNCSVCGWISPPVLLPPTSLTEVWCPTCGQRGVGDRHNGGAAWRFETCPGVPQAVRYAIVTDPDGRVAELAADGTPTGRRISLRPDASGAH